MSGEEVAKIALCEKVRRICNDEGIDFLFIVDGKSVWNCKRGTHIHDVATYHKLTENLKDNPVSEEGYV